MYVRLAFATAIHVDPDVLIVDEALAVGDAIFANRCLAKLQELRGRQITILFVSHDLGMITRLCDRAVLMLQGSIVCQGKPGDVVKRYVGLVHDAGAIPASDQPVTPNYRHGDGTSRIERVELLDRQGNHVRIIHSGDLARIRVTARFHASCIEPMAGILVRNRIGIEVFGTNTQIEGKQLGRLEQGDMVTIEFLVNCDLARQDYTLTAAIQHADGRSQDWLDDALQFTVSDNVDVAGLARLHTQVHFTKGRNL
jgi:ABC-type molybdate transport system ATPase subunit